MGTRKSAKTRAIDNTVCREIAAVEEAHTRARESERETEGRATPPPISKKAASATERAQEYVR